MCVCSGSGEYRYAVQLHVLFYCISHHLWLPRQKGSLRLGQPHPAAQSIQYGRKLASAVPSSYDQYGFGETPHPKHGVGGKCLISCQIDGPGPAPCRQHHIAGLVSHPVDLYNVGRYHAGLPGYCVHTVLSELEPHPRGNPGYCAPHAGAQHVIIDANGAVPYAVPLCGPRPPGQVAHRMKILCRDASPLSAGAAKAVPLYYAHLGAAFGQAYGARVAPGPGSHNYGIIHGRGPVRYTINIAWMGFSRKYGRLI